MKGCFKPGFLAIAVLFCLATPAYALDVTLEWDANTEANLAGYKVYYKVGSSGGGTLANYNGTGASDGDSPIDMPLALDENPDQDIVEFTVAGLTDGQTYYFVVTAYNNDVPPLESGPSNEEHTTAAPSDTTPPYATNRSPAPGATGVPVDTLVALELRDAGAGVDQSTIIMRVDGSPVTPSISGSAAAYTLSYNPPANFNYGQTISVEVDASDLNGNAMTTDAYSFTTGPAPDTTPPYVTNRSPAPGASGVAISTLIIFEIRDAGVGVDQSTITMAVNGSLVSPSISGSAPAYTLSYNPPADFSYDEMVYVEVDASDLNGNAMTTDAYSFTTGPAPDTTPPYSTNRSPAPGATGVAINTSISLEIRDAGVGVDQSTITIQVNGSTVTPSISGTAAAYTLSYNPPVDFNYDQTVSVVVDASDVNGNAMTTDAYSFTTGPAPDTTPPVISNVQVTSITDTSAAITWTTNEASDSEVHYGTTSGSYPSIRNSTNMVTNHTVNLTGLSQNTTYFYRVSSKDAVDNTNTSSELTFTTAPPPDYIVQGLPLALEGSTPESNDATLMLNNIPAGTASIELVLTVYDADSSTEGRLFINGQGPLTLFGSQAADSNDHISVTLNPVSTDPAWYQLGQNILTFWHDSTGGFIIEDISVTFSANPLPDTSPPVISNVQFTSITETTTTITWTTNEPSDSEVQYDSVSRLWGSYPWGENDTGLVTSHSITLNGLEADTTYYFRVGSTDGSGNGPTTSSEMTFTTEAIPVPPSSPTQLRIISR